MSTLFNLPALGTARQFFALLGTYGPVEILTGPYGVSTAGFTFSNITVSALRANPGILVRVWTSSDAGVTWTLRFQAGLPAAVAPSRASFNFAAIPIARGDLVIFSAETNTGTYQGGLCVEIN